MPQGLPVIALSILGGCTIIAAAIVFVSLRTPVAASPTIAPTPAPALQTPPPAPAPAAPTVEALAAVRQHGQDNGAHALMQMRERIVACWKPPGPGEPAAIPLRFNLSFLPDGSLGGWGLSEDREVHRAAVAQCVRELSLSHLRIPAPGVPLAVEVTLTVP